MEYWDPSKMDLSDDDSKETEDEFEDSPPDLYFHQRSQIFMIALATLLIALAGLFLFLSLLGQD